jgi:hypothetical protein
VVSTGAGAGQVARVPVAELRGAHGGEPAKGVRLADRDATADPAARSAASRGRPDGRRRRHLRGARRGDRSSARPTPPMPGADRARSATTIESIRLFDPGDPAHAARGRAAGAVPDPHRGAVVDPRLEGGDPRARRRLPRSPIVGDPQADRAARHRRRDRRRRLRPGLPRRPGDPVAAYLPADARWLWWDPDATLAAIDRELANAAAGYAERRAHKQLAFPPGAHYVERAEVIAMLTAAPRRVVLPSLAIVDDPRAAGAGRLEVHVDPLAAAAHRARARAPAARRSPGASR